VCWGRRICDRAYVYVLGVMYMCVRGHVYVCYVYTFCLCFYIFSIVDSLLEQTPTGVMIIAISQGGESPILKTGVVSIAYV
jgi:hypothetical protein